MLAEKPQGRLPQGTKEQKGGLEGQSIDKRERKIMEIFGQFSYMFFCKIYFMIENYFFLQYDYGYLLVASNSVMIIRDSRD